MEKASPVRVLSALIVVSLLTVLPYLAVSPDESEASELTFEEEYYYNHLSESDRALYRMIYGAALTFTSEFETGIGDFGLKDRGLDVLCAVRYDHPELFYLAGDYKYSSDGKITLTFTIEKGEYASVMASIEDVAQDIVDLAIGTRDAQIALLNERIVHMTVYDLEAPNAHDIRGVLLDGRGVCESYGLTFKYLCDKLGIPCICVIGDGIHGDTSVGHMWNVAMVGSKWFDMDVTWNDPTPDGGSSGPVSTKYSLVGSDTVIDGKKFSESHVPDRISANIELPSVQTSAFIPPAGADGAYGFRCASHYYYDKLTADGKKVYDLMVEALESFDEEFETGVTDMRAISDAYRAVRFERQDLLMMPKTYTTWTDGKVEFSYTMTPEDYHSMCAEILDSIIPLEKRLMSCTTEYSKVLAIHDYLVSTMSYKHTDTGNAWNIYGALVEHQGVCEAYARAFQFLCSYYGVTAICVSGDATNSSGTEGHMWDMVLMNDGKWYAMDVTWDDPLVNGKDSGDVYYTYFLVGSKTENSDGKAFDVSHIPKMAPDDGNCIVMNNSVLPAMSEKEYYIRPGEGLTILIDVTVEGTGSDKHAAVGLDKLDQVADYLQGTGEAVIDLGNGKVGMSWEDLDRLRAYMTANSLTDVTFGCVFQKESVSLAVFSVENTGYRFYLRNGSTEIALEDVSKDMSLRLYMPFDDSGLEFLTFMIFAWDVESPLTPVSGSSYSDGYVMVEADSLDCVYVVGSTPVSGVPVIIVFGAVLLFLLIVVGLVKHHRNKH